MPRTTKNIPICPVKNVPFKNRWSGSKGNSNFDSQIIKDTNNTPVIINPTIVKCEPHPKSFALERVKSNSSSEPVESITPTQSNLSLILSTDVESRSNIFNINQAKTIEIKPRGTDKNMNALQLNRVTIPPPITGPKIADNAIKKPNAPNTLPLSFVNLLIIIGIVVACIIAAATP